MGFDAPEATQRWHDKKGFTFELWTDDDQRTLARHFGAASNASASRPARVTVLLDPEGRVLLEYDVGLNLGTHPEDVLEDARRLTPQ